MSGLPLHCPPRPTIKLLHMEKHFEETIVEVFHVQKSYPKNKGKIRQPSFPDLGWYVCMHLAEAKVVSQE